MIPKIILLSVPGFILAKSRFKIVSILLQKLVNRIYHNHSSTVECIEPIIGTSFFIRITNLPFNVFFTIEDNCISIEAAKLEEMTADVCISSDLKSLIDIFEGDNDGDALFFTRKLRVTGNSDALVRLRNACDREDMNIVDV